MEKSGRETQKEETCPNFFQKGVSTVADGTSANGAQEEEKQPETIAETEAATAVSEEDKAVEEFLSSFTGSFDHSIDAKGRMVVPLEFRSRLGASFVIVPSMDFQTIDLYATATWAKKRAHYGRIAKSELTRKGLRWIDSFTYTGMELDGQGRVLLPGKIRNLVLHDERDVVVSGAGDHAAVSGSIMNAEQFDKYLNDLPEMFAQLDKAELMAMEMESE